ncbi:hypothetical protein SNE40_020086 [Patella caerulea]
MQEAHSAQIEEFRRKLSKKNAIRVINQKLKRKLNRVKELDESDSSGLGAKLKKLRDVVKQKKKQCKRLKIELSEKTSFIVDESAKEISVLKNKVKAQDEEISFLQNDVAVLEEQIEDREDSSTSDIFEKQGKMYSLQTRLFVYDAITNQVPTANVPKLLDKFVQRTGAQLDRVPHRNTVEMMVREMGLISQLQAAETIWANPDSTLGFDATNQQGVHINSVHMTFKKNIESCIVIAVDHLPGGTAEDYSQHIISSINELAVVYADFHQKDYQTVSKSLTANISNSMTDRCASNHATIRLINAAWNTSLNELNCHLHPLDTVASTVRAALKSLQQEKRATRRESCLDKIVLLQMSFCN